MTCRWLILLLVTALAACSSNSSRLNEKTDREYYLHAKEALDKNNYLAAIERLKQLDSRYPFGDYAEQAQLELIYAYFQTSDMENVLATAERFIRLHPLHPQVDYAYYMRGLATFEMSFGFVERYIADSEDVSRRDTTPLSDAFRHFNELLIRFPESPYAEDALLRMRYLRDRLASHQLGVARYYMKRHAFIAAANRAQSIVLNYQNTSSVGDALAIMVEAYGYLDQPDQQLNSLTLLQKNHPDHPQLQDGQFVDSGLAQTDRRSWLEIVTFGLFE